MTQEQKRISENSRDAALIKRRKQGDVKAFAELMDLHRKGMVAYLSKRLHYPDDAEDVTQEVFILLLDAIDTGKYVEKGVFGGWLRKRACHYVWHLQRKRKLITERLEKEGSITVDITEEAEEENEWIGLLPEVMNDLKEEEKKIINWKYWKGFSLKKIGKLLGRGDTTVSGRNSKILKKLKKRIEKIIFLKSGRILKEKGIV